MSVDKLLRFVVFSFVAGVLCYMAGFSVVSFVFFVFFFSLIVRLENIFLFSRIVIVIGYLTVGYRTEYS